MRTTRFFWSAAVILSLWELLVEPLFTEVVMVACTSGVPLDFPRPGPAARMADSLGDWLAWLQPVLLAPAAAWAIRSLPRTGIAAPGPRGSVNAAGPRRGVSLLPATLRLVVALLPHTLTETGDWLTPPMPLWWRECLEAQLPAPSFVVPGLILPWLLSPAAMVLLAGITGAGNRPRLADVRNAALAVAVVVSAVVLPGVLAGPPSNADCTPRYAVAGVGLTYVLDLESGETLDLRPPATDTYVQYDLIVRDVEPGRYVAAISGPSGDRFRLYRLSMDADGQVTLGERLTPTLKGTVNGLAVSPEGRIAYGRLANGADFAGTLEREWPVNGYRLQWLDTRTLLLPDHMVPVNTLATLDVDTGAIPRVSAV